MTTYEKIVKGATKVKVAAPKPKYIEPILMSTLIDHSVEAENFVTIMKALRGRLQDSAWSVVYKLLIVIHIMIREGDRDVTLNYLVNKDPNMLNLSHSSITKNHNHNPDVRFIVKYAKYLHTRVKQYEATGIDYVRDERANNSTGQEGGRLRTLTIEKGLLRECESVQRQIDALLKNNFMENEINNDIVLTAFRMLVNDLLALFQELNEGVINILEHYFETSKVDAERALRIYKKFVDQTKYVIDYLRVAKHLEYATKLHVPTIKHAPTALTSSLEEYLDDPNFEVNRRQYLAGKQTEEKETTDGFPVQKLQRQQNVPRQDVQSPQVQSPPYQTQQQPQAQQQVQQQVASPGLQRTNSLIVQQSTFNPWGSNLQPQQVQMLPQGTLPSGSSFVTLPAISQGQAYQHNGIQQQSLQQQNGLTSTFTGAGFGGYGSQLQLQTTGGNPFLQNAVTGPTQSFDNFASQQQQQQQQQQQLQQQQQQQLQQSMHSGISRADTNPFSNSGSSMANQQLNSMNTGSNPFFNTRFSQNSSTTPLSFANDKPQQVTSTATGSNPFKVSETTTNLFNNVSNGPQPQLKPQPTAGGLENLPTVPVFPDTQQESQKQYFLNNARMELQQQVANNQQFPQQPSQQQPQQQQWNQPHQFQQMQPQYTQNYQQPQQASMYNNNYEGPSLI